MAEEVRRADLRGILNAKFRLLGSLGLAKPSRLVERLMAIDALSAKQLAKLHDFDILDRGRFE